MVRHQPAVGELPDKANEDGQPELDMLPVAAPLDIHIAQANCGFAALAKAIATPSLAMLP